MCIRDSPRTVLWCDDATRAMDPSQRPTSNAPPNPYGQPQAPAYGYPYGQAPPAQAYQAPQQAYYQTPSTQADVFAALAQAPPVYEALIAERDRYMAHALRDCEGSSVVGVVGLAHLDGIVQTLMREGARARGCALPLSLIHI